MINKALTMYRQGFAITEIVSKTGVNRRRLYENITSADTADRKHGKGYRLFLSDEVIEDIINSYRYCESAYDVAAQHGIGLGVVKLIYKEQDRQVEKEIKCRARSQIVIDFKCNPLQDGRLEWVTEICNEFLKGKRTA